MRLAVVTVGAGDGEGIGHLVTGSVKVILVGHGVSVRTGGNVVLVEHNVVGEATVVQEGHRLALGDGDVSRLEHESAGVGAELHGGSVGGCGEGQGEGTGSDGLYHGSENISQLGSQFASAKNTQKSLVYNGFLN